jgi:hypothetical protein
MFSITRWLALRRLSGRALNPGLYAIAETEQIEQSIKTVIGRSLHTVEVDVIRKGLTSWSG